MHRSNVGAIAVLLLGVAILGGAALGAGQIRAFFSGGPCARGEIVFDSSLSGNFGIYRICLEGGEPQAIEDRPEWHEVHPDPSPDGTRVVFARAKDRNRDVRAEIWIKHLQTGEMFQITDAGNFPTFSPDGNRIYFERWRFGVFVYDLSSKSESLVFPQPGSPLHGKLISKPRVSNDERWIYFTADAPTRWTAWRMSLVDGSFERIGHGCQPFPVSTLDTALWVQKRKDGLGTDFFRWDPVSKTSKLEHYTGPQTFGYYPTLVPSGEYLLYSGCNCHPKKNSHESGNYELMVLDMAMRQTTKLTSNGATNRWPKLLPPVAR